MALLQLGNGLGEGSTGDVLASAKPLQLSGKVWWVNSVTGVDAGGTAGQDREKPLATIGQAVTNASDYDIVALQAGHSETRTTVLSISKSLTIVGIGTSSGKPAASLRMNHATNNLLSVSGIATANSIEIRNIYFPANQQNNTGTKLVVGAAVRIVGCYFEQGATDLGNGIDARDQQYSTIYNTTFISTGTSVTARPATGLLVGGVGVGSTDLVLDGVVFSDGPFGFSNAAMFQSGVATPNLRAPNVSLLLGACMNIPGATGWINLATVTGGGRVIQ